jgi:hypothetical protein
MIEDNVLYSKEKKRLISFCSEVTHFQIPESVTEIGDGAFSGCSSLQSVSIPESVAEIGDGAFYKCKSLHEIIIPKGTKTRFEKLLQYSDLNQYLIEQ